MEIDKETVENQMKMQRNKSRNVRNVNTVLMVVKSV